MTGMGGGASTTFVYDGDGNRVKGKIGTSTTYYVGNYFEWTGSTDTMKKYYYAGGIRVAVRTGSSDPLWLLGDHLGSTSKVANFDGLSVHSQQLYKPWGESRYASGTLPTTYKFTGQREESYINLYWYNSRWYDPALGRWIQPDTMIPQTQGVQAWDRFSYVNNSPTGMVDPTGHWGFSFNLSNFVNSAINSIGLNSTDVVNGLNTVSTVLDGAGLVIDTAIAAGDVISGVTGILAGGFVSIPEAGGPSVISVPGGAGVAMGAFELNPITRIAMGAGNALATASTLLTAASDIMSEETNIAGSLNVSDGEFNLDFASSIGRDTLTSIATCALGWASPIGLTSAPIAAAQFANDLGFLFSGPLSIVPQSVPLISADIEMEWDDE